ncbi:hypothetical protein RJT34_26935 [Clitoria ternatea]|uniref:Ribosomal protein L1 n=1 Tax=Clitoria ternatea TaxID=43366 RepID=A0AAN9F9D4_CLITE
MASERVSPETVAKAVDALLKWRRSVSETQKPKLFDEDEEFVYLILTMKKIPPKSRINAHKIPIPHPLTSTFSEHCLIIDDRPNKARITKAQAQSKIQSESIPIAKVLKLSKLASDYRPFEAKRKLCNSYDLFFTDKSIVPLLPRLLGKFFYKKRKLPVPIDLKKNNWKEQVDRAFSSAMLFLRTGTCSVIRVAKVRMERDEIVENIVAAIQGIADVVPKNWANIRSLHVKLLESVALPIFQVIPDLKLRIEGKVENEVETIEERKRKKKKDGETGDSSDGGGGKKKKGRIHEVRYMHDDDDDDNVGEDVLGSEGDGDSVSDEDDKVNNKRKKKKGVSSELNGVKRVKKLPAKEGLKEKKRKGLTGESEGKVSVKDEESGVKKKKKGGDVKVKAKKSKKVA